MKSRILGRCIAFLMVLTLASLGLSQTVSSVTLNPTDVDGGSSSSGTVTLSVAAPTGGSLVSLASTNSAATVPASVTVAPGATTAPFTVTTTAPTTYTTGKITATLGTSSASGIFSVGPKTPILLSIVTPSVGISGSSSAGTVSLTGPATVAVVVTLTASDPSQVTVPASVTVPIGKTSANFSIKTLADASTYSDTITAKAGTVSVSATMYLVVDELSSSSISPSTLSGGTAATGTVTLHSPAPAGGWVVTLKSPTKYVVVPGSITIAAGSSTGTFPVTTMASATTFTIEVLVSDAHTAIAPKLSVDAVLLSSLTLNPEVVKGGSPSTGTVTLTYPAPTGGWKVSLNSQTTSLATVPTSITIAAGASTGTFAVGTKLNSNTGTSVITAQDEFSHTSAVQTVQGPLAQALVLQASTVMYPQASVGTVSLDVAAPAGGTTIPLTSSSSVATVPASVVIAAGNRVGTFKITIPAAVTAATTANISIKLNGTTVSSALLVRPDLRYWIPPYKTGSAVTSKPVIGGLGQVYVGSQDGLFYALNPTGTKAWSLQTNKAIVSSPVLDSSNNIYFSSTDGSLNASAPKGQILWTVTLDSNPSINAIESSPTVSGGTLYVGCDDNYLYSVNTGSGAVNWKYPTLGAVKSKPAVDSAGNIYFGSGDENVYSLTSAGEFRWSYKTAGAVYTSAAIGSDGTVYIGSADKHLYAFTSAGKLKYTYITAGVVSTPAIGPDGTIYFVSGDSLIYAVTPGTASAAYKWSYATGGPVLSNPSLGSDGTVYVGSTDGYVYAITSSGTLKWSYLTGGAVNGSATVGANGYIYIGSSDFNVYSFLP